MPEDKKSEETNCSSKYEQVLILNEKHMEKIASATLGRLDDISDAVVTSRIWDTSLHLVSKFKVTVIIPCTISQNQTKNPYAKIHI